MRIIFHKKHLPLMEKAIRGTAEGRDHWNLAVSMLRQDGLTSQQQTINMQLQQGAWQGDVWCMCELARSYYRMGIEQFPQALYWWHRAAAVNDKGTLSDLKRYPIEECIFNYHTTDSEFADMVARCAMMSEWVLTDMGRTDWNSLPLQRQVERVQKLTDKAVKILCMDPIQIKCEPAPIGHGKVPARGIANYQDHTITIKESVFGDYPDLIAVCFHEIGHFVEYSMWNLTDTSALAQRQRFGVTEDRVHTWYNNEMQPGATINTLEADADTLSYNVLLSWLTFFAN